MRFSGQGLMSHTSTTTISRFFEKTRGKALSTAWFGLSTAEFFLPVFITYLLIIYSWRSVWQGIAIIVILFLPLVILNTIKSIQLDSREENKDKNYKKIEIKSWKRREVIKDYRFYIVSLNMLAMPWIATGVFVYQSFISESKMWASYTIPKAFMVYSITSIVTLIISGFLVDKFSGRKLILFMNLPLLLAMFTLFQFNNEIFAYIFLGLIGVSNGLANILGSSTWAEIYGVNYIGSIKALTTAFMVFSTAFGTAVFGLLIDSGFSIENIAFIGAVYILVSLFLLIIIKNKIEPVKLSK
jgi:predicted MFS family arabinose efflux permease